MGSVTPPDHAIAPGNERITELERRSTHRPAPPGGSLAAVVRLSPTRIGRSLPSSPNPSLTPPKPGRVTYPMHAARRYQLTRLVDCASQTAPFPAGLACTTGKMNGALT